MGFYIITYDLRTPGQDYTELYNAIKALGEWQHPLESVWFLYTDDVNVDSNYIYQRLRPCIDNNDFLFINRLNPDDKQGWMVKSFWNWYNSILERTN